MHHHKQHRVPNNIWLGLALGLAAAGFAALIYLFPPEHCPIYPKCLLHSLTGLQCPSCGGLRAAHHLLHGHFRTAFALNPLFVTAGPFILLTLGIHYWARKSKKPHLHISLSRFWIWLMVAVVVLFGIGRNIF